MIIPVGGMQEAPALPVTPWVQEERRASQSYSVDETLRVEALSWYRDLETGFLVFEGEVKAFYGLTVLSADSLTIDGAGKQLTTVGRTQLVDPEGTMFIDDLQLNWATGYGTAKNVRLEVGYVLIEGRSIEIIRDPVQLWRVKGAQFQLQDLAAAGFKFSASEVVVEPGKKVIGRRVFYQLLGQSIGPIPEQTISLDRRVTGFRLPSLANRRGVGFGVSWKNSFLLDEQSVVGADLNVFPSRLPQVRVEYTRSFIDGGRQVTNIAPRNELDERYANGWFNSIFVQGPEQEQTTIRDPKNSYSVLSAWNQLTQGRLVDETGVSKLVEFVYELGGPLGDGGYLGSARLHRIRESGSSPWVDRSIFEAAYLAPRYDFGGAKVHARLDGFGSLSEKNSFGIVRGEVGLFGEVLPGLTVGGAYVVASQFGTSDFLFDRLAYGNGMVFRADYVRGPYKFRYMRKYDFSGKRWFDTEWEIALAAGSLEPFVTRREFPSDFRIGVRFRIDGFRERLVDRDVNRKNRPE